MSNYPDDMDWAAFERAFGDGTDEEEEMYEEPNMNIPAEALANKLSEWFNDQAPLGWRMYLPCAEQIIAERAAKDSTFDLMLEALELVEPALYHRDDLRAKIAIALAAAKKAKGE